MRISVTGINGFVGTALKNLLADYPEIELVQQPHFSDSLDDMDTLLQTTKECNVIVHLAAKTFVPDSFSNPYFYYRNNINSALSIIELCRIKKIRLVYLSSYVYGQPQYMPIDEKHPVADFNPYAHSKIIGEQLCERYAKYFGLRYTVLRPFNIYGKNQPLHFVTAKIMKMSKEGSIQLEDPRPRRDYINVEDVAAGIVKVILNDHFNGEIFNLCSGRSLSIQEIVDAAVSLQPGHVPVAYSGIQRPHEILDIIGDNSRANEVLQWKPAHNLIEDIQNQQL